MRRAGRVVDEERLVGRHRLLRLDPVDRLVGHVDGEVVVLHLRRLNLDRPVVDQRIPLVGFAADEAVELVEALLQRPAVERTRHAGLPGGGLVPLAEGARAVAIEPQHFGQRRNAVRVLPGVARKSRRGLHDGAGVDGVVVSSGLERVAGRRAQRRGVEVVEPHTALRQLIHRRRPDGTAEGARPAEADVVDQHDHDVRSAGGRLDLETRRRLGVPCVELGVTLARRFGERQHRTVDTARGGGGCGGLLRRRAAADPDRSGQGDAKGGADSECAHDLLVGYFFWNR